MEILYTNEFVSCVKDAKRSGGQAATGIDKAIKALCFVPHILGRMHELFQSGNDRSWCRHDISKQKNRKSQVDKKVVRGT